MPFTFGETVLLIALALLSALFSASETALISLSKIRLRHMMAKGVKGAKRIQRLLTDPDKFIIAILVGNNIMNIAMSAIVTAVLVKIFGNKWGVAVATLSTAIFVLVFCEITPKIISLKNTEKVALFTSYLMEKMLRVFSPLLALYSGISKLFLRMLGIEQAKRSPLVTEEELRVMIEVGREEGIVSEEERKMLHRIFEFGDTRVSEVMVPRDKIVAVAKTATAEDVLDIFVEKGHARLPVYEGTIENIIGIIYARDILYLLRDKGLFVLSDIIHEAYYFAPTTRVNELLRRFQMEKIQIAIVVDRAKKTQGLVTLEDLIEEIVGELEEKQPEQRATN